MLPGGLEAFLVSFKRWLASPVFCRSRSRRKNIRCGSELYDVRYKSLFEMVPN